MNAYPQFYKKGSKCIMREGDTHGMQLEIPEKYNIINVIHTRVTLPSKKIFDDMVKEMETVSYDVYKRYLLHFYQTRLRQPRV